MSTMTVRLALSLLALSGVAGAQLLFGPSQPTTFAPLLIPGRADLADVNEDGQLDLVKLTSGVVTWHAGNGTGQFAGVGTTVPGMTGSSLLAVDLDGDGAQDLVTSASTPAPLQIALAASGGFEAPSTIALGGSAGMTVAVSAGDAEGDGDQDLLVVLVGTATDPGVARLYLNDGAGMLAEGPSVAESAGHRVVGGTTASFDGDGEPDLVAVTTDGVTFISTVWLGQPGGGLSSSFTQADLWLTRAADLDADGDLDLIAPTPQPLDPVVIRSALNAGDGRFTEGPVTDLGLVFFGVANAAPAEFDGDAFPDLVVDVPESPAEAWFLRGDGTGGFELPGARVTLLAPAIATSGIMIGPIADVDADGRLDATCLVFAPFQTWFTVSLNRTYPAGGALLDLGHQLKSPVNGWPIQVASGSFAGGTPFSFKLSGAPASSSVVHVVGLSVINAPFKGGTMVPMPTLLSGPWPTTSGGLLTIAGNWPMGVPAGLPIAAQFWSSGPGGWSASSGVLITTP